VSESSAVLGLHFLLEIASLSALAYWGWTNHEGYERWLWTIVPPLVAVALWAIFRAPADPQVPIVAIPGAIRLVLELLVLSGSAVALFAADQRGLAIAMVLLILFDYALYTTVSEGCLASEERALVLSLCGNEQSAPPKSTSTCCVYGG
jgi:hypothetical protein